MSLTLYAHPFSSYSQKVLIALWENDLPFAYRNVDHADPTAMEELKGLWSLGKFPVLVDGDRPVIETSVIIEHLQAHYRGPVQLIPDDVDAALDVRFMDRFFDNYVMAAMQGPVFAAIHSRDADRQAEAMDRARTELDTAYAWLEQRLEGREWACGDAFSLADCAAAPSLFYADWVHQPDERFPRVRAYRARLNARPSFARAIDEARPYRHYFPLGAPDRD